MNALPPKVAAWFAPPKTMTWWGLDIGGANLKIADGRGRAVSEPFALWKHPDQLGEALGALIEKFGERQPTGLALTMTGELADCYATKSEGVRAIVAATVEAIGQVPICVATTDDRWISPTQAADEPMAVAAANWRVAARLVARNRPQGHGYWIDIGSTTVDLIPLANGRVATRGSTDTDRLLNGELVYTGVRRTPVCAVVDRLPYRGRECPVAAEWFATTADAWLLLGLLAEDASQTDTADGRPFTRSESIARLARCVCADSNIFNAEDARLAAEQIGETQQGAITAAMTEPFDWVIAGGEGEFLARRLSTAWGESVAYSSIKEFVGPEASDCLPAHAAAVLAALEIEAVL